MRKFVFIFLFLALFSVLFTTTTFAQISGYKKVEGAPSGCSGSGWDPRDRDEWTCSGSTIKKVEVSICFKLPPICRETKVNEDCRNYNPQASCLKYDNPNALDLAGPQCAGCFVPIGPPRVKTPTPTPDRIVKVGLTLCSNNETQYTCGTGAEIGLILQSPLIPPFNPSVARTCPTNDYPFLVCRAIANNCFSCGPIESNITISPTRATGGGSLPATCGGDAGDICGNCSRVGHLHEESQTIFLNAQLQGILHHLYFYYPDNIFFWDSLQNIYSSARTQVQLLHLWMHNSLTG